MRFLTLEDGQLGVLIGERVVDLPAAAEALGAVPSVLTFGELVKSGDDQAEEAWELGLRASDAGIATRLFEEVHARAPIPRPGRNIMCVGKNYREHAKEIAATAIGGSGVPERPIFFTKATTAVIGCGDPIPSHSELTSKLDYEAEVAIVIGREARNLSPETAMDHVFGYTAINDVTARDLQAAHVQWFLGKSLDGAAPMGPTVVHRSAMPEPERIRVRCWVNGDLRQDGNLGQLIFDIPTLLVTLSRGMTLLPGDIIATGTPKGVGAGFEPPRFLVPGDEVAIEVTGAGRLVNRVS
ncbi:MAG: fumarylacetoacetate hydrolase family protein [Acidobacteria bacterium]|nr:fumarylacetoacetate hydrolase family protein [Acidobacteriota bacterium]